MSPFDKCKRKKERKSVSMSCGPVWLAFPQHAVAGHGAGRWRVQPQRPAGLEASMTEVGVSASLMPGSASFAVRHHGVYLSYMIAGRFLAHQLLSHSSRSYFCGVRFQARESPVINPQDGHSLC